MAGITQKSCVDFFRLWSLKNTFEGGGGAGWVEQILIDRNKRKI